MLSASRRLMSGGGFSFTGISHGGLYLGRKLSMNALSSLSEAGKTVSKAFRRRPSNFKQQLHHPNSIITTFARYRFCLTATHHYYHHYQASITHHVYEGHLQLDSCHSQVKRASKSFRLHPRWICHFSSRSATVPLRSLNALSMHQTP